MYKIKFLLFFLFVISFLSCKKNKTNSDPSTTVKTDNSISYAKGFSLQDYSNCKKLSIHTSFQGDTNTQNYFLVPKSQKIPDSLENEIIIRIPIDKIVVTSTTHIPMLELLGVENKLVGFPNTTYISSLKTRTLIENGKIKDIGQDQNINTEILLELQPELVVGFGINNTNEVLQNIKKMGIPVVMNSDWLEQDPLGRAEWLRFFGAIFQKDSLALARFDEIENNYNNIKKKTLESSKEPTVLSGSLFQDVWHMPAGNSFVAHFLEDAKSNYLWNDSKGTGSLSLSLESVLEKGKNADFWIAPGYFTSKAVMLQNSPHYKEFKAFTQDNIFTYANTKGPTGGVLYFELATARPDLVLQDLAHILHPEVFPNYEMVFFKKLN